MADPTQSPEHGPGSAARSGYLPVSEHGLIGDMHCVALVGTNGTIDWHCSPSFDAPSMFGSILDADRGGCFELAAAVPAKTRQFYHPDTNVLITRFFAEDGVGEIQDFMPVADAAEAQRHRLIRRVLCVRGTMPFRVQVSPVRIGNAAAKQLQLDIYGELMDSVYLYDDWHQPISSAQWDVITTRAEWLCDHWDQPDEGIWETRGGPKKFLYSQLMCWVAMERAIRMANRRGLPADLERWRAARDAIYRRIMDRGWSSALNAFAQYEGADVLDAAVLMMPLVKFISPTDPKWLSTLDALTASLVSDSLGTDPPGADQRRVQPRPRPRLTSTAGTVISVLGQRTRRRGG